ncbi:aminotransferase class V-fold PLP-dependent enzyme [Leucobacter sp. CSA2]|uniref:Aminotransferase class V-fold PLP-dependent enzyme n=1 Tax=Leucobacter edaphi TaxID=2796472 RepID=A0A934QFE9_9MICO|nr:aminotransferase class V-fold PLP-dependent enzyme [Leucobacter edaphi]MBK0422422.1 aminotransferase class V-fold PLP-dependent enzyme [Leucobacter edaphi]
MAATSTFGPSSIEESPVSNRGSDFETLRGEFTAGNGYLAACTAGLPPQRVTAAMHAFVDAWAAGRLDAHALGDVAEQCRARYAELAGVAPDRVALGGQVSQLVSIVATSVPDGAEVLCAAGDFSSLTHPFEQLARRGVRVRYAPVAELARAITPETALVAFSHVQSATGEVADADGIQAAAAAAGARTLVDLTQSLGWLPTEAGRFDYTVCHAYKWLCAPRGTSFMTVREGLDDSLTPIAAGWCSADDVWSSCYAGSTPLAASAGRFDLSPSWPLLGGTLAALEFFTELDIDEVMRHDIALANAARAVLGLPAGNSAIVTWPDPDGTELAKLSNAGITASGRAGNARIAFHLWNTKEDVDRLERALRAS